MAVSMVGGVASLRTAASPVGQELSVRTLGKALDAQAQLAATLLSSIPSPAYGTDGRTRSTVATEGSRIDVTAR